MTSASGVRLVGSRVIKNQRMPNEIGRPSSSFEDVTAAHSSPSRNKLPMKKRTSRRVFKVVQSVSALRSMGKKKVVK